MLNNGLRWDWCRKLEKCLGIPPLNYLFWPTKIKEFQAAFALKPTGFIDAPTRLKLADYYRLLDVELVGMHLTPRCLIHSDQTDQNIAYQIENMLVSQDAYIPDIDYAPTILAIRGVEQHQRGWCQTASAMNFASEPYGNRTHFSANKDNYNDALFAIYWRENGNACARLFMGCVNPNHIWPHGTAHLAHGTYLYRIGKHRTREQDHIDAVLEMIKTQTWPSEWLLERTEDSVQYVALESVSQIEVIRSHGDCLDISPEDVEHSMFAIASRAPNYVDAQRIKINIHSCAVDHASSLGCQNILPNDYADFMGVLMRLQKIQRQKYGLELDIPYCLADASMID
ncbi:MAG: hypothetical protein J6A01_00170 [Proteobacteria bacterium]|nr:hypothetical protein [Pseudomonadota bacterium]